MVELSRTQKQIWEKPLNARVLKTLTQFSQHFIQGLPQHSSPLLQLPYVGYHNVKPLERKLKLQSFRELLVENSEKRKILLEYFDNETEKKEIRSALNCISLVDVEVSAYVDIDGERRSEIIKTGDFFTVEIKLKRKHKYSEYIYSKNYELLKKERLTTIVYLERANMILHYEHIFKEKDETIIKFQKYSPQPGRLTVNVYVDSDSYIGTGIEMAHSIDVAPAPPKQEYQLHPEDEEALEKPSFFMSMLQEIAVDDGSDNEYEEDEKNKGKQENQSQAQPETQKKENIIQKEDDSSEEDIRETK